MKNLQQHLHRARHFEALLLGRQVVADELVEPLARGFDFSQLDGCLAGFGAELVAGDVDFEGGGFALEREFDVDGFSGGVDLDVGHVSEAVLGLVEPQLDRHFEGEILGWVEEGE